MVSAGVQIGTRVKTKFMEPYIFKVRPDGLFIIDTRRTDERIRVAAKFLANFPSKSIVAVSFRLYGRNPVLKFCEVTGAIPLVGRFPPGTFTNPLSPTYIEPDVVIVTDPSADEQAVNEALKIKIPVIALCDTDNTFKNIDLIIPTNNKGRKALALVYWLLARQLLRERGEIPSDGSLQIPVEEFETKLAEAR
jgi:small subunit ribosomal protein S2